MGHGPRTLWTCRGPPFLCLSVGVNSVNTIVRISQIMFFLKSRSNGVTAVNNDNTVYFPYVSVDYEPRFVNTGVYGKTDVLTDF